MKAPGQPFGSGPVGYEEIRTRLQGSRRGWTEERVRRVLGELLRLGLLEQLGPDVYRFPYSWELTRAAILEYFQAEARS